MLFQLRGRGHPQDDATPNFCADSKHPILGLSNEVSFVQKFFGKMVKIKETPFLSAKESSFSASHCTYHLNVIALSKIRKYVALMLG